MCHDCFEHEYASFPTEQLWLDFDLKLTKKLGSGKMKYLEFKGDGKRDKDDGKYYYECSTCREKWKLEDPDYSFRGYFLKI